MRYGLKRPDPKVIINSIIPKNMFGAKSTTPIEHNIHAGAACIRAVFLLFVGVMNSSGDSVVKALDYLSISWSFKPQ